jgi:hypothetical protein
MANWTPETSTEAPGIVFENVSTETARELDKLKKELAVEDTKTTGEHSEWKIVAQFFEQEKWKIKSITRWEIEDLKKAIIDSNENIEWTLTVVGGKIEYNETPELTPISWEEEVWKEEVTDTNVIAAQKFLQAEWIQAPEITTKQWWGLGKIFQEIIISIMEGIGMDTSNWKAKLEWYKDITNKYLVEQTMKWFEKYLGKDTKISLENQIQLVEHMNTCVPLMSGRSIFSAPIIEFVFTGNGDLVTWTLGNSTYYRRLSAIRGKYLTLNDDTNVVDNRDADEKLKDIFTIEPGKEHAYITRYNEDVEEKARETEETSHTTTESTLPTTLPTEEPESYIKTPPEDRIQQLTDAERADVELAWAQKDLATTNTIIDPTEKQTKKDIANERIKKAKEEVGKIISTTQWDIDIGREVIADDATQARLEKEWAMREVKRIETLLESLPNDPEQKEELEKAKKRQQDCEKRETIFKKALERIDKIKNNYVSGNDKKAKDALDALYEIEDVLYNTDKSAPKREEENTPEWSPELTPLDPRDKNNLLFFEWKLYQVSQGPYDKIFKEIVFKDWTLQGYETNTFIPLTEIKNNPTKYKAITYEDAQEIIKGLTTEQMNLKDGKWIYVEPGHFAGKLRGITLES